MRLAKKSSKKLRNYNMDLQLTSMIDMFTILLVFLLKSYSVETTNISISKDLKLPVSSEKRLTNNILNVIVTTKEILVEGESIVNLYNKRISDSDLGPYGVIIKPLYNALRKRRDVQQESIKVVENKVILQADKDLEYKLIKKVLYTTGEAGYPNFKFLVLRKDE